jgi:hypothetical protein
MNERYVIVDRVLYGAEWDARGNTFKAHSPGDEIPLLEYEHLKALRVNQGTKAVVHEAPVEEDETPPPRPYSEMTMPQLRIQATLAGVQVKRGMTMADIAAALEAKAAS